MGGYHIHNSCLVEKEALATKSRVSDSTHGGKKDEEMELLKELEARCRFWMHHEEQTTDDVADTLDKLLALRSGKSNQGGGGEKDCPVCHGTNMLTGCFHRAEKKAKEGGQP